MKLYDLVRKLIETDKSVLYNDHKLCVEVWRTQGLISGGAISEINLIDAAESSWTIRRTRQKILEDHPELVPDNLERSRRSRQKKGQYFVYHERVPVFNLKL